MQTHCPHCDTHFRVTDNQIDTADGFVRCGICEQVFNVYEVDEAEALPVELDEQPLAPPTEYSAEETEPDNTDDLNLDIIAERDTEPYPEQYPEEFPVEHQEQRPQQHSDQYTAEATGESFSSLETLTDDEPDNLDEHIIPADKKDNAEKDTFNFFDENDENSVGHVVPEELRDSYESDTPSAISNALWGFGVLLLTVALFIEYAWFNRNQFAHIPEVQTQIEKLCQQFDCEKLSLRAPEKIELVARNIYSHPNEQNILMVNVTIKNNASFSQPYPILKIDFSDIRGGHIASRNFLPSEYLAAKNQNSDKPSTLLGPDANSSITMEIVDPGKQALTYEFNFL